MLFIPPGKPGTAHREPPLQQHIGLLMLSVTTKLEATQKFGVAGRLFPVFFFPGVAFGGAWSEGPS